MQFAVCDRDLRGGGSSDEVFPATHKSGHKRGTAEFTTMPKCNDNSEQVVTTRPCAAREEEENTWVSTRTGEQLVETMQAFDKPRHHTAKTVCVRRSRGETDALANSDAGKRAQLKPADWVNANRWMILMTRSQKIGRGKRIVDQKAKKPQIQNAVICVGPERRDG